jgi:biotin carboxylase
LLGNLAAKIFCKHERYDLESGDIMRQSSNLNQANCKPVTVLILGNYRTTLTVARTLSEAGYRTIVTEASHGAAGARYSRFVDELWHHPPVSAGKAFYQSLNALLANRPEIQFVFPVEESFSVWLANNAHLVPNRVRVVSPSPYLVRTSLDKPKMLELATQLGLGCPPFATVKSLDELYKATAEIGFPVIVRPFSHLNRIGNKKAIICQDQQAFDLAFEEWPKRQPGLLVQRYVKGARRDLYFIARNGEVSAFLQTNITRTDNPDGTGLSTEGKYSPVSDDLASQTAKLVKKLDYSGIGFTQFIVDDFSGHATFLELNPRTAGSHKCAEAMGLPLTLHALEIAGGPKAPPIRSDWSYRAGGYYCWLSGDLYGLKQALLAKEITAMQAAAWGLAMLRTAVRARVHLTWSLSDPLPSIALLLRPLPKLKSQLFQLVGLTRHVSST